MREQTYALLGNLLKRLEQLGEPASSDANSILASGAIALLGIQNQDVKVSATMCLDYAQFVERKVQELEAKYGKSAPSMQTRSMQQTSAPIPEMPGQQPLVRRPVVGVRPTPSSQHSSTFVAVPAQGEPTLRSASQVPETMPHAETPEQQPLVRRLSSTQMPRVTASGEASSAGRDPQQPPVSGKYPRTSSL